LLEIAIVPELLPRLERWADDRITVAFWRKHENDSRCHARPYRKRRVFSREQPPAACRTASHETLKPSPAFLGGSDQEVLANRLLEFVLSHPIEAAEFAEVLDRYHELRRERD